MFSDGILEVAKYLSIVMIVVQLLFSTTLQAFQVSKVKGAMRIYLLFDFLSVFAINTGLFLRVKEDRDHMDKLQNLIKITDGKEKDNVFNEQGASIAYVLENVCQLFVGLRKVFLVLIINDAYIMLCEPFQFKDYLESKMMIKRYLGVMGVWFLFYILHMVSVISLSVYLAADDYPIFSISHSVGLKWTKHGLVFAYNCMLFGIGCMRCRAMHTALHEMDQNEFAKNAHCNSLFKMSMAFCILTGISIARDILNIEFSVSDVTLNLSIELVKAAFDTFFSIIVMIAFVIFFPGLRPRLNANEGQQ